MVAPQFAGSRQRREMRNGFMIYFVYILKSIKTQRYYVGHTKDVNLRLIQHNAGKVRSTKSFVPWELIYMEELENKSEAYKREMQIKSYKGGVAFKKLLL